MRNNIHILYLIIVLSAVAMLVAILRDEGYTYEYTYKDPKQKKSGHFLVSRMMQIVINPDTPPPITAPPTRTPTKNPTKMPTSSPTKAPVVASSMSPSFQFTNVPSIHKHATSPPQTTSSTPSFIPSKLILTESENPSYLPTTSIHPSSSIVEDSAFPSNLPSNSNSEGPTSSPVVNVSTPTYSPMVVPVVQPSELEPTDVITQSLYTFTLTLAVGSSSTSVLPVRELSTIVNSHIDDYFDDEMDEDWGFIGTTIRSSGWENQRELRNLREEISITFISVSFYGETNFEANHSIPSKSVVGVFQHAAFLGSNNKDFLEKLSVSSEVFLSQVVQVEARIDIGESDDDENIIVSSSDNGGSSDTNNILLLSFLIVCVAILGGAFFLTYKRRRRLLVMKKRRRVMDLGQVNDPLPSNVFPTNDQNEEMLPIYNASHSLEVSDEVRKVHNSSGGKGMGYYLRRSQTSFDSTNPQLAPLPEYPHPQPMPEFISQATRLDQYEMRTADKNQSSTKVFQPVIMNGVEAYPYHGPMDVDAFSKVPQSHLNEERTHQNDINFSTSYDEDDIQTVRSIDTQTKNQVDSVLNKLENVVQAKLQRINSSDGSQPSSRKNSQDVLMASISPPRLQPLSRRNSADVSVNMDSPSDTQPSSRQSLRDVAPTPPLPPRATSPSVLHDIYDSTTLIPVEPRPLHRAESSLSIEDVSQSDRDNARHRTRTRSMSPITILRNRLSRSRSNSPAPHRIVSDTSLIQSEDVGLSLSMADLNAGGGARGEVRKVKSHNRKRSMSDDAVLRGLDVSDSLILQVSSSESVIKGTTPPESTDHPLDSMSSNSEHSQRYTMKSNPEGFDRHRARSMSPAPHNRNRMQQLAQPSSSSSRPSLPPLAPAYIPEGVSGFPLPVSKQTKRPLNRASSLPLAPSAQTNLSPMSASSLSTINQSGSSPNISIDSTTDDNSANEYSDNSVVDTSSVLSQILTETVHKEVIKRIPSLGSMGSFDDTPQEISNHSVQALQPPPPTFSHNPSASLVPSSPQQQQQKPPPRPYTGNTIMQSAAIVTGADNSSGHEPFENYEPNISFQRKNSWSSIDGSGQQQLLQHLQTAADNPSENSVTGSLEIPSSEDYDLFEPPSPMAEIDLVRTDSHESMASLSSDEENSSPKPTKKT